MGSHIITEQVRLKAVLDDRVSYQIPRFQREYSWEDDHLDDFWKDLVTNIEKKEPYFFGSIMLVNSSDSDIKYKIIDGQQRLSTSITFLCVIRDILIDYNQKDHADGINAFIRKDPDDPSDYDFKLEMSKNNQDFFLEKILTIESAKNKIKTMKSPPRRSKKLSNAYKFLYGKLIKMLEKKSDENKIKHLNDMAFSFLRYFIVIRNEIDTIDRAYRIFDTINNRGIRLNQSDLVKNYLLEEIDQTGGDIDGCHDKWLEMLKVLDDINVKESDFLRHHWLAQYGSADPEEIFEKISKDIKKFKTEGFIQEILESSKKYKMLKDPSKDDWNGNTKLVEILQVFKSLNAKAVYPVLLKGMDVFDHSKDFPDFVKSILIFFFRSKTVCSAHATAIETLMNKVCSKLRSNKEVSVSNIRSLLKSDSIYPSDAKFEFEFSSFDANSKNALYILSELNAELHKHKMTLGIVKGDISVEHIMPMTIKNSDWEPYLIKKNGLKKFLELDDYHKNFRWKLGNLTLLNKSENKGNASFQVKREKYYKDDEANITNGLIRWSEWHHETISERQREFSRLALKIWTL
ncbi:MAG: DUF262 domain-containing HNH endonuclease family protein [Alphaproteobacteria bacterium]|nr:DUF262 domain-containing HNH endonuclease family protein [Alphaproteobacteria bacterium]